MRARIVVVMALGVGTAALGCTQIFGIEHGSLIADTVVDGDGGGPDGLTSPDVTDDQQQPLPDGALPDTTPLPTTLVDVALGEASTCVALSTGEVRCWGYNQFGQIGDETTTDAPTSVKVHKITTAKQIASGQDHVCALLSDTSISCWGADGARQIGVPTPGNSCSCVSLATDVGLLAVDAGGNLAVSAGGFTSLALRGQLFHWGAWTAGGGSTNAPTAYSLGDTVDEAHAGDNHACYRAGGTIKCWGLYDSNGELGRGSTGAGDPSPAAVVGVTTWQQFAIGVDSACGVTTGGDVYCWGSNLFGKLGSDSSTTPMCAGSLPCSATPLKVDLGSGVMATQVSVGSSTACALITDGTVRCWGTNTYGECGHAAPLVNAPPTQSDVSNVFRIQAGGRHVCAILTDHKTLKCWGHNDHGQLGYSAGTDSIVPTSVSY